MALFSKNKEKVFSNIQHVVGLSVPEDCDCQVTATQRNNYLVPWERNVNRI